MSAVFVISRAEGERGSFTSAILPKWERRTRSLDALLFGSDGWKDENCLPRVHRRLHFHRRRRSHATTDSVGKDTEIP